MTVRVALPRWFDNLLHFDAVQKDLPTYVCNMCHKGPEASQTEPPASQPSLAS